jgi:hypothetical protein
MPQGILILTYTPVILDHYSSTIFRVDIRGRGDRIRMANSHCESDRLFARFFGCSWGSNAVQVRFKSCGNCWMVPFEQAPHHDRNRIGRNYHGSDSGESA